MKQAVRAIVVKDNSLLVMKRNKFGSEYYTLIGGHVEMGESTEHALLRELHEETMIEVTNPRLVYIESAPAPYGEQYIYLCDYVSGEPQLHEDADEKKINALGKNMYTPMWLSLNDLNKVPFKSDQLKEHLEKHLKNGFPKDPIKFSP